MAKRKHEGLWMPIGLLTDGRYTFQEKGIIAEVSSLNGPEGCYAKNMHFARFLGVTEDRVSRIISKLVDGDVLVRWLIPDGGGIIRYLAVFRIAAEPSGEKTGRPYGENTGTHTVKTPDPHGENTVAYNEESTERTQEREQDPPPSRLAPKTKKAFESVTSYNQARWHLEKEDIDLEFYIWFEVEVMGRYDAVTWTIASVRDFWQGIWQVYGAEVASAAVSAEKIASGKKYEVPIDAIAKRCKKIKADDAADEKRAERLAEHTKRVALVAADYEVAGSVSLKAKNDDQLEAAHEIARQSRDSLMMQRIEREKRRRKKEHAKC